jgi:hypothetical protein
LDEHDIKAIDIFLPLLSEVATTLRAYGIQLEPTYLNKKLSEFSDLLTREVDINGIKTPFLDLKLLPQNPEILKQVRASLEEQPSTLIAEVNNVLHQARVAIKERHKFHELVVILDNLEKVSSSSPHQQTALFLDSAAQLTGLQVHLLLTLPLSLVRKCGGQLEATYGRSPFVLPMIKVEDRQQRPFHAGYARFREIVEVRMPGQCKRSEAFEEDALDWLIRYSGGDIRSFMRNIRTAVTLSKQLPVKLDIAQKSLRQSVATFSTSIPESHWIKLAKLQQSATQTIDNNDPDFRQMLEQLTVLEYINGDEQDTVFESLSVLGNP